MFSSQEIYETSGFAKYCGILHWIVGGRDKGTDKKLLPSAVHITKRFPSAHFTSQPNPPLILLNITSSHTCLTGDKDEVVLVTASSGNKTGYGRRLSQFAQKSPAPVC